MAREDGDGLWEETRLPLLRQGNFIVAGEKGEAGDFGSEDECSADLRDRRLRTMLWIGSAMATRTSGRYVGRQAQIIPTQASILDHIMAGALLPVVHVSFHISFLRLLLDLCVL